VGDKTGISWTDATWSCVRGCSRVSPGCERCYAEQIAGRFSDEGQAWHRFAERKLVTVGKKQHFEGRWTRKVALVPHALSIPLKWRRPRRIFVNSTSDTFHEELSNEEIAAIFGVMAAAPQHTFQVLTKRANRMHDWLANITSSLGATRALRYCGNAAHDAGVAIYDPVGKNAQGRTPWNDIRCVWPLPNVWLGVSVENQDAADQRIPWLLLTPAAVRFLSCEPLLGPVDLHGIQIPGEREGLRFSSLQRHHDDRFGGSDTTISWVIAGCESGRGARECKVEWLRALRDQCAAAGVPYFLKQAEESVDLGADQLPQLGDDDSVEFGDGSKLKGKGPRTNVVELPYLDGVQHAAFPAVAP